MWITLAAKQKTHCLHVCLWHILLLSLNNGLAVGSPCSPLLSLWWAVDTQDLLIRDFDVFCSARAVLATPNLKCMNIGSDIQCNRHEASTRLPHSNNGI